jgi:hypothetical protein
VIFVLNLVANARAFFPLVSAFARSRRNKRNICGQSEYRAKRRFHFSEYTEECCSSPFEFDVFTFMSATVRLE